MHITQLRFLITKVINILVSKRPYNKQIKVGSVSKEKLRDIPDQERKKAKISKYKSHPLIWRLLLAELKSNICRVEECCRQLP